MKTTLVALLLVASFLFSFRQTLERHDDVDLNQYAGTYKMKAYFQKTVVVVKEGDLYGEVDANGSYKLIRQDAPDTFKSTSSYGTIYAFKRDEKKQVTGVTLKLMGEEVAGDKE